MNHSLLAIFIALPLLILGALFLYDRVGPYIISYAVTTRRIEIRVFNLICIRWINYSNIADIREVSWRDSVGIAGTFGMIFGESWGNRVFVKSFVLIKLKRSFFHRLTITPENPKYFVEQVKTLLNK